MEPKPVYSRATARVLQPLLGGFSGAAIVLAGPPYDIYPLILVALVPLLVAAGSSGAMSGALAGWLAGIVVQTFGLAWLVPTIARLQGLSCVDALPAAGVFIAYHALPYAAAAVAAGWLWRPAWRAALRRRPGGAGAVATERCPPGLLDAAAIAAAWVVIEWAFPRVLPWYLGSLLGPARWLRQAADLGGVYGLSFFVVFVNALVAPALLVRALRWRLLAAAIGAVALMAGYGAVRVRAAERTGAVLRVALVQGDISLDRAGGPPAVPGGDPFIVNERAWATYSPLTTGLAVETVELIVWPESALRVLLRDNPTLRRRIGELVDRIGTPILLGALARAADGGELNSAYLIAPGDAEAAVYHKVALVPFGEYVPGARHWRWLSQWHTTGDFRAGHQSGLLTVVPPLRSPAAGDGRGGGDSWSFAVSICVEAILPGWFNAAVGDGAACLVNLTDDSWFAGSVAARQHLEMTRLRAVETRRWLMRASNGGSSAFIDPSGDVVATLPAGKAGTLVRTIGLRGELTPYVRCGDWVVGASAIFLTWCVLRRTH